MEKNENIDEEKLLDKLKSADTLYVSLKKDDVKHVVCEVCGKKNLKDEMLCNNCSNYLKWEVEKCQKI